MGTKIPKIGASMYGSNGRMYTTVPIMQADYENRKLYSVLCLDFYQTSRDICTFDLTRAIVLHISNFFSTVHVFISLKLWIWIGRLPILFFFLFFFFWEVFLYRNCNIPTDDGIHDDTFVSKRVPRTRRESIEIEINKYLSNENLFLFVNAY